MTNQKQNTKNTNRKVWYGNRDKRKNFKRNWQIKDASPSAPLVAQKNVAPVKNEATKIEQKNNAPTKAKPYYPKRQGGFKPFNRNIRKNTPAYAPSGVKNVIQNSAKGTLRIIPLGGCEEVGRNMTVFEYENDIVVIDMGMQFPEENQPGIDFIIPNTEYLKGKEKNIRGVIFTHGHLDHIGASPLLLNKLGYPVIIGSKLTVNMIKGRQDDYEKNSAKNLKILEVNNISDSFNLGNFKVKFFAVSHSIMDATGIILETPVATVIHPGDWKIERDPASGSPISYEQLSRLKRPTILMLESLGAVNTKPSVPEKKMYENIDRIISEAKGRIIIGTFSSMLERIKLVLEMAEKYGKKVAVMGFSMKTNLEIAKKLGYIKTNLKLLVDIGKTADLPDDKLIVICTGAQGEENAAMARIANGEDKHLKFKKSDTVIFSSSVIPGNERAVQKLKDLIYRQSDNVIHSDIMDVHSSGHSTVDDFKEILRQIKATYLIPVYANHYMLKEAAKLAKSIGYEADHIFVPDNGSVLEFAKFSAKILPKKVDAGPVFVDGLGISDLQNVVLRDRQTLSEGGMVMVVVTISRKQKKLVRNPDIISRGFVYLKENKILIDQTRAKVRKIVESQKSNIPLDDDYLKDKIRNELGQFLFTKTEKRPMVLPVVIEV
jgi:ribonuclease J